MAQLVIHRPNRCPQIPLAGFPRRGCRGTVGGMFAALLDLLLPTICAGCATPGAALCATCAAALSRPYRHVPATGLGLPPVCVAGRYDGVVRAAILAYKERGRRELSRALGGALAAAVAAVLATLPGRPATTGVVLVPVPSRAAAARARGGDHMRRLADRAAAVLGRQGVDAVTRPILWLVRTPRDAAGLTSAERAANIEGALAAGRLRPLPRGPVILVDDLVTTGSTLAEAARALRAADLAPAGAAAVAATIRRHPVPANRRSQHGIGVRTGGHDLPSTGPPVP